MRSFLEIVEKRIGDGASEGDKFGGASGATGQGLPTGSENSFMFATGIECSYPRTQHGRRDQLAECGHYEHWRKDFELVRELGLKVLRYGLPYHLVNPRHGKYDWSFADEAMRELKRLGITPILDLMHFGVPDWIGDYQNPELPVLFAEYAAAVAARYPWVRYYTPVNEIFVTARASTLDGIWNERQRSDRAFVTAIKHGAAASILACHSIAKQRPNAVIVQSESAEYVHDLRAEKDPRTELINRLRFLPLDLLYAHRPDAGVMLYLLDNGLTRKEYEWFMAGEPPGYQVMGNDYYGRNERMLLPDGRCLEAEDVLGWYNITHEYYRRYRKPVMHTETNHFNAEAAPAWLWKQWSNVLKMRELGVPVLGFTWYSLTDQVDWDSSLADKRGNVMECGLFDLERRPRQVAHEYRKLLEEFGQIKIVPHGEMFDLTHAPALLKAEI
jgi:beta-glucosidase/6-phospho-beta-glucosidase/beta-galactosidase